MPVQSPEDLYGLPLPRFIPERAALVKALRSEKRRDEATAVAAMRKPSVAAWAVNTLVRTQGASIRALFAAGDDLAKAQSRAASGKPAADALHAATRRQRDAVGELLEAAQGLLSSDGNPLTASTLERVRETLRAASIDSHAREQVQNGCLDQELEFAGLGICELNLLAPESSPPRRAKPEPAKARNAGKQKPAERAQEIEAARKRKAALSAARQAEAEARRSASRAAKELAAAQSRHRDATASLQTAEERLAQATERSERTAAELEQAQRSLAELEDG